LLQRWDFSVDVKKWIWKYLH